jgi:hypothetical protein
MRTLFLSFFFLLSSAAAQAPLPPERVEVAYELTRNGSVLAEIVERLEHGGGVYEVTETWRGKGLYGLRGKVRRWSRGSVAPEGLRPLEFSDERTGRKTTRARFDWDGRRLTLENKGETRVLPLPQRTQDRLSYVLNFAFHPPGPGPVTVHLTDGRGVSTHIYDVAGRERLNTPAGEFDAVKLVRRRQDPQDRSTEIWLAADRGYLPVRLSTVDKDGTRIEQVATRISRP